MTESRLKLYKNNIGIKNQLVRLVWDTVWLICARWIPRSVGNGWKRTLLRLFGAHISSTAVVYSSTKIYYPANLWMDDYSCLAPDVVCYNVAPIILGKHSTVSQRTTLCTASHDITDPRNRLVSSPILINQDAWVGMEAYIGMGVTIGDGAVVGARSAVFKDVEAWTIVGGNPATYIKKRILD